MKWIKKDEGATQVEHAWNVRCWGLLSSARCAGECISGELRVLVLGAVGKALGWSRKLEPC